MNTSSIRRLVARSIPYQARRIIPLRIAQHLYFEGIFCARLNGRKIVKLHHAGFQIENEIFWRGFEGCHEKQSMQVFANIIQQLKPKNLWDIGANSGTYGLLGLALHRDLKVTFFEPIPKAAALIRKNLQLNSFEATVFETAVGDYDGQGEIYFEKGQDFAYSVTVNKNTIKSGHHSDCMTIQVHRLESLIVSDNLDLPDLVKLDVETYEYEVLKGLGDRFPKDCIFLIEILSEDLGLKLMEFFPQSTHQFWNINDETGTIREVDILGKSDLYNFLIAPITMGQTLRVLLGSTK